MDNSHLLTRADTHIIRGLVRNSDVPSENKYVPEYVHALILKLAETLSQAQIAKVLNQQAIFRPNGKTWQQFHLCRYFQEHGIVGAGKWRGTRNGV